ncbi:MAG: hypothetical protein JO344_12980, partial [Planctomycetaceae bacterium]|nr:hypothetical protein [Planctomycetaceae bacterium]
RFDLQGIVDNGDIEKSLEEALDIVTRDNMHLFEIDCHLMMFQFYLRYGRTEEATRSQQRAQDLIQKKPHLKDYKRREKELKLLADH